jgi:hypothetical protein
MAGRISAVASDEEVRGCCQVDIFWIVERKGLILCSVYDADGQFLLIEAADALPSWITPENVENRVRSVTCV